MSKRPIAIISVAVGVVLILITYGLIVRSILSERSDQEDIKDKIALLESALDGQQGGAQVLSTRQTELAMLQATLEAVEFAFPSEVDSTEVLDYIITAATTNGVNLNQVEARVPVTGTIGSSTYRIFAYDVEVEGELESIAAFLATLEAGDIETLTLDQIGMEAQSVPTVYRATLVVQVYFRR